MRVRLGHLASKALARDMVRLKSAKAVVSIAFDDVPSTACHLGATMVEEAGGRATYYVSGGLESIAGGKFHTQEDLKRLHISGHEIGCHGFAHIRYTELNDAEMRQDIEQNQAYFEMAGIPKPTHFAYPFGAVNVRAKRLCGNMFETCRGIHGGILQTKMDRALLQATPLHAKKWTAQRIEDVLNELHINQGWAIFYAHSVSNNPEPYDTTPEMLDQLLKGANARGIDIMTISAAFRSLEHRNAHQDTR